MGDSKGRTGDRNRPNNLNTLTSPPTPRRHFPAMDQQQNYNNIVQVVVNRNSGGYGMKVSGDNPVYVQSVKEGGPAEKAGLQEGDKIIQVNGKNVVQSTHTEVVDLIKSSVQVLLTVQQRSPSQHSPSRLSVVTSPERITGPQPVDNEKQHKLQQQKEQYYRLMIEKEQHHLEKLRGQVVIGSKDKRTSELAKVEKNLRILQDNLRMLLETNDASRSGCGVEKPPPLLPKRNRLTNVMDNNLDINAMFLTNEINSNNDEPPPLPPRNYPPPHGDAQSDTVNSIDKQMSYPLVATLTSLMDSFSPTTKNSSITKSSPEGNNVADNGGTGSADAWERPGTPPGTPPPPYHSNQQHSGRTERMFLGTETPSEPADTQCSSPNGKKGGNLFLRGFVSSPVNTPIITMEDDDMSDLEIDQAEDHGPFKSLSRLWEHLPHLAIFMNYVLSNSDPHSLLFYLLTDLYKEGTAKEMRKWAFEIHSCFLVPGAPLRLNNVDENIAREIDDNLTKEYAKEEIMRKIFWKARSRAKEELTRQLTDFQQKRTAGLGTMYGPSDTELKEYYGDKVKEQKLYEMLFFPKMEPYFDEIDKENYDPHRYFMAASLMTIFTRIFRLRFSGQDTERCPTFVNKERSFKTKLMGRYSRKLSYLSHQFVLQQFYSVTPCNNCHQIIYGISPQGYQCAVCLINLHRHCVKLYDDSCPGPILKKDRGIRKFIGMRHDSADQSKTKKMSSSFISMEKDQRHSEEHDDASHHGDSKSDRKSDGFGDDSLREADHDVSQNHHQQEETSADSRHQSPESSVSLPAGGGGGGGGGGRKKLASNINRSESVKEQSEKRKQRRNISDPSHNTSGSLDLDRHQQGWQPNTGSGSSSNSNISCNGKLSDSPSNSIDVVQQQHHQQQATVHPTDSDSDIEAEADPLNWQDLVSEEELSRLDPSEKKRQDVINELFHTEFSHVQILKVLYRLFYKKLQETQVLKPDELGLIFPNIKELLDIHSEVEKEMRRIRKQDPLVRQIGDMLVDTFGGPQGELLQKAAATFCERQQLALEFIKKRRERDSKFDGLLAESEKKRQCRRLQLQGIVPAEMQRLVRYPLLLERLIKSVETCRDAGGEYGDELAKLQQAHNFSKEILNHVNEAAKAAHNRHRLEEIQKHLDTSSFRTSDHGIVNEFRNIDLTRYQLILEGSMQLRRPNKAPVPVHILLLEEMVVVLHRENDKFLLKFFQSGSPAQPLPLSPIIKMNTLLVRNNAVCKNALFLVNTSTNNSQMYDLVTEDETKRETWYKRFSEATEAYNRREGKISRIGHAPSDPGVSADDLDMLLDIPPPTEEAEPKEAVGKEPTQELSPSEGEARKDDAAAPEVAQKRKNDGETPEQIRQKDEIVRRALADKEDLVADLLFIPREHFQHIADLASTDAPGSTGGGDITDRLLASIFQVDILQKAVNDALNVTEAEVMARRSDKAESAVPTIPASFVRDVASSLSSQLTNLLSDFKQVEEERDRLRQELSEKAAIEGADDCHSDEEFCEATGEVNARE
ncbi:rho guanine nucleotide exchange factor 11 isoform X2 [Cylas formicarius]|uniref:rho guanine nucleotide exchange factor 11 isoform X2 n=1 Tax=Cylas formicarius TaxID=197179 RepID=UPI002958C56D|nr:rho guanine nucleotide exchange factor 11 isoform X2 [Cylas formicarius]